jgi:hypothetical protein
MRARPSIVLLSLLLLGAAVQAAEKPPVYVWLEPEWFQGVEGRFAYWPGPEKQKATGHWGVAGPGITAEWSQGGESEWNSMGAAAAETKAECRREIVVPRAGKYRLWVRYVDHRGKTEPFSVKVEQGGKAALAGELGVRPLLPPNDEWMLYWGFSFGWAALDGPLKEGPAQIRVLIDKPGEAWRQVDALLLTDDPEWEPVGREKPPFAYQEAFKLQPKDGPSWRGAAKGAAAGGASGRKPLAGRDFTMWTHLEPDPKWWAAQNLQSLSLFDALFHFAPNADIQAAFQKQFAGRKDLPVMAWPGLRPGFYLGRTPDLSPESPVRQWLERTRTPFYLLTNYANPRYDEKSGPATYAALSGPLAGQFLGFIHGETIGSPGVSLPAAPLAPTRRGHVDALAVSLRKQQAERWTETFKTPVPESFWNKGIPCLSVDSIALAHAFHESGSATVGYEIDATNAHAPMRIAFERGAARQYGGSWINYASGNFGDACNYFTQEPIVPRGAKGWWHSKYSVTDGVPIEWYRKLYYLNYLGGASAIYWEQGLGNQWMLPGPGAHPIDLSPFGRATEEFQAFVDRLPDRGEPYAPVAFLLSYGHGYEPVNYHCKMLGAFEESAADRELRELFNVAWHPTEILQGLPITPDTQSMPSGIYGNLFDVLVDRPDRAKAVMDYPVLWAAGDVDLGERWVPQLEEYVRRGGTLVLNVEAARGKLPQALTGVRLTGRRQTAESWTAEDGATQAATPYEVEGAELAGAKPLAWAAPDVPLITRNAVGKGAVLLTLVPQMLGKDERAHPALPYLMNGLTEKLLPVEVRLPNGERPHGEIMYQVNRTKDGWLVMLMNNRGVDKTQTGIARVDRRQVAEVVIRTALPVKAAREYTQPRELTLGKKGTETEIRVRVHPGDVQVVGLVTPAGER